ncbi:hypothetical protein [Luteococcus sanguinis]|uniref:hypothetical protein n=1 Tax=Luteococcus sanguinis TaxID=174038 RepID=UPI0031DDB598
MLGYFDTDAAQSTRQGDVRATFTLDRAGRRVVQDTTVGVVVVPGAVTGTMVRHYTDSSDNPAWTVEVRDGTQTTTRFGSLTGDGLGITFTTRGTTTAELALAGLRGDINATITLDGTNPANGIDAGRDWTKYGHPHHPHRLDGRDRLRMARTTRTRHPRSPWHHPHGRPPLQPNHRPVHKVSIPSSGAMRLPMRTPMIRSIVSI